jgi:hypothetical protein
VERGDGGLGLELAQTVAGEGRPHRDGPLARFGLDTDLDMAMSHRAAFGEDDQVGWRYAMPLRAQQLQMPP